MRINSKEKFINLLLATMAQQGCVVETFDFEKDLLKMMSDRRYSDLFYFFESMEDLDFADYLEKYQREGLIKTNYALRTVTINLMNKMFYQVSNEILGKYNPYIVKLMAVLIREIFLSSELERELPSYCNGHYKLDNPNGMHLMHDGMSLVTDGEAMQAFQQSTGGVIIQDATFLIMQEYNEKKLANFQLYYKFEDKRFIFRIVKEILQYYKMIEEGFSLEYTKSLTDKFSPIDGIKGYKYKKY